MPSRLPASLLLACTFAGGLVLGGCRVTRPNPDHCYHAGGDASCAQLDPSTPYCAGPGCEAVGDGCVAERPPEECYSPCGEGSLIAEDASCIEIGEGSEESEESEESETGEVDMGSEACLSSDDCPEEAPYCLMGSCLRCDEAPDPAIACFELSGGEAPVCLDGTCVECEPGDELACTQDKLWCDPETLSCVACTAHDQCPGQAGCDIATGECLPHDAVFHVDGDGGQDYLSLSDAMAALGEGSGTLIVHAFDQSDYAEGISLSGDRALAVFGAEGEELPVFDSVPVSLEVLDGARVYARRLVLNGDEAVLISAAHLELDSVQVAPSATRCVSVDSGVLHMRNSMLRSALSAAPVVEVAGVSELDIRYSTLLGLGPIAAVACQGATIVPGSRIRNSILVNLGDVPSIECASPAYEHNGLEDAAGFAGNTTLGEAQLDWFLNAVIADLHLALGAPIGIADGALWSEGDPSVDFDGDPRPASEGSTDFLGADRQG